MCVTAYPLRKALATNSTAADFTAKTPTATKPTGDGVFEVFDMAIGQAIETYMPQYINIIPFGTDANDEAFTMRLWGWSKVAGGNGALWIPQMLVELTVTLGNIAATAIAADHFLADTIAIAAGDADAAVVSPANDTPASILVHLRGVELFEFDFDKSTAAAMNAYWRMMDQS